MAQSLVGGLLLLEDIRFFLDGSEDSIVRQLQWHTITITFFYPTSHSFCDMSDLFIYYPFSFLCIPLSFSLWCYQAAQITHVLGERISELTKEAEQEKALKEVVDAIAQDNGKAAEIAEKKA